MKRLRSAVLPALLLSSALAMVTASMPTGDTGSWLPAGSMAHARRGASSVLLANGTVLVSGGAGTTGSQDSVELFEADGAFSMWEPMLHARAHHSSVLLPDGRVLVVGGRAETVASNDTPASSAVRRSTSTEWR